MEIADTSFLYALLSKSDTFHRRALAAARFVNRILVPNEIFAETVSLIRFRIGFSGAQAAGNWLRSQEGMLVRPTTPPVSDHAWTVFQEGRGRLSYPDAVVVAWCQARRAKPLTFDRAILRKARR